VDLLDTVPGVAHRIEIISEIGSARSCFLRADHLAACVGVAPGNNHSMGKCTSGGTCHGDKILKVALVHAPHPVLVIS